MDQVVTGASVAIVSGLLTLLATNWINRRRRQEDWDRQDRLARDQRLRDFDLSVLDQTQRWLDRQRRYAIDRLIRATDEPFHDEDLSRATSTAVGDADVLRHWVGVNVELLARPAGSGMVGDQPIRLMEAWRSANLAIKEQERRVIAGERMKEVSRTEHPDLFSTDGVRGAIERSRTDRHITAD